MSPLAGDVASNGNDIDTDACLTTCKSATCGDMFVHEGVENCDDGNASNTDACIACSAATCGDGFVHEGVEACDDGNASNTDACIACKTATCGDGFVHAGVEECDDSNAVDTDACVACKTATCGDGFVHAGVEECDDGNNVSNDGCSAQCEQEIPPQCLQPYNAFTVATRIHTYNDNGLTINCDRTGAGNQSSDWVGPGWYRFTGAAGTQLATAPPGDYSCGTHAAGWLNDVHPTPEEGVVQRTVCFDWTPGDCWQTWQIGVVNCGDFYLYNLPDTINCSYVYCGMN